MSAMCLNGAQYAKWELKKTKHSVTDILEMHLTTAKIKEAKRN